MRLRHADASGADRDKAAPGSLQVLQKIACEVATVVRMGMEVALVVGGGNYFRGSQAPAMMERATADYVGMLATCMNAIMLQVCSGRISALLCCSVQVLKVALLT